MDTTELNTAYTELAKRFEHGHLTKAQIDNITSKFNKAYDSYIEFRKISYMTPVYTKEAKRICICFSELRRRALSVVE